MNILVKTGMFFMFFLLGIISTIFGQTAGDFTVQGKVLTKYRGKEMNVVIPANLGITEIGKDAFRNTKVTSVRIPDKVTVIGDSAFYYCNKLTSITIPASVTVIGDSAFRWCDELTSISIPAKVTAIGKSAFTGCKSLTTISIPAGVTVIEDYAFSYCEKLTAINVDNKNKSYTSVDGVLFNKNKTTLVFYPEGRGRQSYTIPEEVTRVEEYAFSDSQLTSLTIPSSFTTIEDYAFCGSWPGEDISNRMSSVIIPTSVTSIGRGAFSENQVTSVTIGANVTLGHAVFGNFIEDGILVGTGFNQAYENAGKRAGTYTRPNADSKNWVMAK